MRQKVFEEMQKYLEETRNLQGTWLFDPKAREEVLITIIKQHEVNLNKSLIEEYLIDFECWRRENCLEEINFRN